MERPEGGREASFGRDFRVCLWATFMIQSFQSMFFMYPQVLHVQGFSLAVSGWLMSAFNLASTASRPVAGRLVERAGFRNTLVAACLGLTAFTIPLLFARSGIALFVLRLGMGFFWGVAMVGVSSYQSLAVPPERRGSAFALVSMAYVLPQLTLFVLVERFISLGYVQFFVVSVIVVDLLAAWFSLSFRGDLRTGRGEARVWGAWSDLPKVPGFWVLLGTILCWSVVNSSILQYLPMLAASRGCNASAFIAVNAAMSLVVRLLFAQAMNHMDRRIMLCGALTLMGAMTLLLLVARTNVHFIAVGAVYGFGMGFGFPAMLALMPDIFPEHLRPKGVSVSFFALDLGFIVSPFLVGYGGQLLGLDTTFALIGVTGALTVATLYFRGWRKIGAA